MTRPGSRLRAIAARVFDVQTMERYVDPAVADLQTEYEEAVMHGQRRHSARIWILGHVGVIQVISIQGGLRTIDTVRELTDDDRRALLRTVLASAAMISIATLIAMAPMYEWLSHPRFRALALYLIPQALPLSIPVGLIFGILWGLGRVSASRPTRVLVLLLALGASVVSFSVLAWVMPSANQAFRTTAAGRSVPRGDNELTIGELRERIHNPTRNPPAYPSDRPYSALNYHGRWALGATPFVLAIFALIVTTGRKSSRTMPFVIGPAVIFGYYVIMYAARELGLDRTISPFAAAWAPNAVLLMLSAAVVSLSVQRRKRLARTSLRTVG